MEESTNPQITTEQPKKAVNKLVLFAFLVAIALVIYSQSQKGMIAEESAEMTPSPTSTAQVTPSVVVTNDSYKNGVYEVKGDYVSPGGDEQIDVQLTIKDNIVSDAQVTSLAERPISKKFQGEFISGYKQFVVGKNINEVKLDKISGSSLTPKGFNDAVEKIKTQAKV